MHPNQALKAHLEGILTQADNLKSLDDIALSLAHLERFTKQSKLGFEYSTEFMVILGTVLSAGLGVFFLPFYTIELCIVALIICVLVTGIAYFQKEKLIKLVSDKLFFKSVLIQNTLTPVLAGEWNKNNGVSQYQDLAHQFRDFNRGNDDQYIIQFLNGVHAFDNKTIPYQYYQFHYVDIEIDYVTVHDTERDTDGNTKSVTRQERRERRHVRYRYGILLDFLAVQNLMIGQSSYYNETWTTTAPEFNDAFVVSANETMTAAKFLQPAVLLKLVTLSKLLDLPELEFNKRGKMCLSFADNNLLNQNRENHIKNIEAFKTEILGDLKSEKLQKVLSTIETLFQYNHNSL